MKTAFKIVLSVLGLALVGLLVYGFFFIAYRDWSFICENTGSRKGYREWFFGTRTQHWQSQSSVEPSRCLVRDDEVRRIEHQRNGGGSVLPDLDR